jgi:hypothetical protein
MCSLCGNSLNINIVNFGCIVGQSTASTSPDKVSLGRDYFNVAVVSGPPVVGNATGVDKA